MPKRDAPLNVDALPKMQADVPEVAAVKSGKHIERRKDVLKERRFMSAIWPAISILILCIIGLSIWNGALVERASEQRDALVEADLRISKLEQSLFSTDESMTQSSVVLQVRLKEIETRTEDLWTQMDKLWASAWRRNQTEIADHGKRLDGFDKTTSVQQEVLKGFDTQLTAMQKSMSRLKSENVKLAKNLKVLTAKEKELSLLKDELLSQMADMKKLRLQVDENTQWQKSNMAFRQQTNKTLSQLEKQLAAQTKPIVNTVTTP